MTEDCRHNPPALQSDAPCVSRRAVLARLIGVGAALTASSEADAAPAYADAGPVSEFKPGTMTRVVLPPAFNQEVVYVFAPNHQPPIAVSARCTHKGCVVAWDDTQHRFLCPCHGGQFGPSGDTLAGPPPRPLRRLRLQRRHGRLLIEVPPLTSSSGD